MLFLKKLLSFPLELIRSLSQFGTGIWQDGGRGQFLIMGLPAVVFMILGGGALVLAAVNDSSLDSWYENLARKANVRAKEMRDENRTSGAGSGGATSPEFDERKQELIDEKEKEQIFLNKLIWLDAKNAEHKFKLAMLSFQPPEPDFQRGESLMQVIAPFDEPGYPDGHLFLTRFYLNQQQRGGSPEAKLKNQKRAEQQIENCLIADETNTEAKLLKAIILDQTGQYLPAYVIYEELFETDPIYYQQLINHSIRLGRDYRNILDRASYQFRQRTGSERDNVSEWVIAWKHYVHCLKLKKDYSTAERALSSEIGNFRDDIGREVFLKKQLSLVYSQWAESQGRGAPLDVKRQQLSNLAKALENDRKNTDALRWLVIMGTDPEIAEDARRIYDPRYDSNTPWKVLLELGNHAVDQGEYENAITYFEQARKKHPRNPTILNNLAHAYTMAKNRNPELALLLVDQALTNFKGRPQGSNHKRAISSFCDTRGVALMQLNRMEDAAASFEIAFQSRPTSIEIINRLIECYLAIGNDRQASVLERRKKIIEKKALEEARSSNNPKR